MGRPDVKGREEILAVHTRMKPLGEDVDLHRVAQTTSGFTGADLENLMNEAAIHAAREGRKYLMQSDIDRALLKWESARKKKSRVMSEEGQENLRRSTRRGMRFYSMCFLDVGPVHTVSIIPTGTGAGGYTMPLPESDEQYITKGRMLQQIMVSLGGRIAEELAFDDITAGASQDIRQATAIARAMVTEYGMSERIGMIDYGSNENEVFIGRDLAHARTYGEDVAAAIDQEIKRIIDECYQKAKEIILSHKEVLSQCSQLLLEREKIGQAEFEELFKPDREWNRRPDRELKGRAAHEV